MASQAVERASEGQVPALAQTPALEITAADVALPRLYIGQFMSKAVQNQLVQLGCIYSATGQDDGDPQVLYDPNDKKATGVVFYVLAMTKGKSLSDGGELQTWAFDDPSAPPEAWTAYHYTIAIPDVDPEVPFKFLPTPKSGRPAALKINTVLSKNAGRGPAWHNAFRLTTAVRQSDKGKWAIPEISIVDPDPKAVDIAEQLALLIAATQSSEFQRTPADEPAI